MKGGIYQIINKVTGKFYVGRSTNVYDRMKRHKRALKRDTHRRKNGKRTPLQRAWNKYGEDAFIFQPIDFFETEEEQKLAEKEVIDTFWESGLLYNKSPSTGGGGATKGKKLGPRSEETKRKISKSLEGRSATEEHKQNISKGLQGRTFSDEHRQNVSKSLRERPIVICPHCGREGRLNMTRYHFDNCKHREI